MSRSSRDTSTVLNFYHRNSRIKLSKINCIHQLSGDKKTQSCADHQTVCANMISACFNVGTKLSLKSQKSQEQTPVSRSPASCGETNLAFIETESTKYLKYFSAVRSQPLPCPPTYNPYLPYHSSPSLTCQVCHRLARRDVESSKPASHGNHFFKKF